MCAGKWCVLLLTIFIAGSLSAAEPPSAVEQEVLAVDMRKFDAMTRGDAAALDALLAPEATYVDNTGRIDDKQSILYGIRSKTTTYEAIVATERRARVIGNVAVVQGVAAIRGTERKARLDLTVRYIATYERRGGRWQMTAGQSTQLVVPDTVISGQSA
jgi:ketosteroid isomerase-like protein